MNSVYYTNAYWCPSNICCGCGYCSRSRISRE